MCFGDGTVVMRTRPGNTPAITVLLVRLKDTGVVLLTGDLAHFRENMTATAARAELTPTAPKRSPRSSVSTKIAANLKATVVIQHDAPRLAKLPPSGWREVIVSELVRPNPPRPQDGTPRRAKSHRPTGNWTRCFKHWFSSIGSPSGSRRRRPNLPVLIAY